MSRPTRIPGRSWIRAHVVVTGAIVAMLVSAGGLGGWFYVQSQSSDHGSPPRADGPTLYQALAPVTEAITNLSGGPWGLMSIVGIAAQIPFSFRVLPSLFLPSAGNDACRAAFNGLTLWNGSIPLFHGTFDSGTAPFWQFGFYSENTEEILVATNVEGTAHIYPPISEYSPCASASGLAIDPQFWVQQMTSLPEDSPSAAESAWGVVDHNWVLQNQPETEMYYLGPTLAAALSWGGYFIHFLRCGEVGVGGFQPLVSAGAPFNGSTWNWGNYSTNCAVIAWGHGLGDPLHDGTYRLIFSPASISNDSQTIDVTLPFQVGDADSNGTFTQNMNWWGLANWMTSLNVTDPSHQRLSVGAPSCSGWVPSLRGCPANASGWFTVLESASGEWMDSYGALGNGTIGWTVPIVPMLSGQRLVVVVPATWGVSGDTLQATSTAPYSGINGTVAF